MRDVTDLYDDYQFTNESEGPGCGNAAHDDDCLHDVDLAAHPTSSTNVDIANNGHGKIATKAAGPLERSNFERWLSEYLGNFEVVGANAHELDEVRCRLQHKYGHRPARSDRSWGRAEVVELLRAGLSFPAISSYTGVPLSDIVATFTRAATVPISAYVETERLLRRGTSSLREVHRKTGVPLSMVQRLAVLIGVKSDYQATKPQVEQSHEEILRLRNMGLSYGQIAKALGYSRPKVVHVCQRKAG